MIRKCLFTAIFLLLPMAVICQGGEDYSDVLEANEEFYAAMEKYIDALDNAKSAGEVAAAMNLFADGIEKVAPKMKKARVNHPELKDPNNMPEELTAMKEKSKELNNRYAGSFMKLLNHLKDPEVKKAQERVSRAMMAMADDGAARK